VGDNETYERAWDFFNRPAVKAIVNYLLGLATATFAGIFFGQISQKEPQGKTWLWGGLFGISFVVEAVCVIAYKRSESKANKQNKYADAASQLMENLQACYRDSAASIYSLVENGRKTGEINLTIWNCHKISDFVCEQLYSFVRSIACKGGSFSVSYIIPAEGRTKGYLMISYGGSGTDRPSLYQRSISHSKASDYYFAKLFKENNPAVSYLMNAKEISEHFCFPSSKSRGKYSQYIGIPIYCAGHDMVGLLQIVACHNSIIEEDKEQLERIVDRYIMGYADLILFAEKIQKGIVFPQYY